ncbi:hypothetical protein ACFVT5_03925 [Streptomyces sp. NPDC058001]|uniref:hypothetical protein n=1 Tax=Streptomyces sp. NPDC058001 TaxID=3346300 RepID=UPI0036ED8243
MGTDIHGYVECRTWGPGLAPTETAWYPAVPLPMLGVARDYPAYDCLFGVRGSGVWRPVAAGRGLPPDASETVTAEMADWGPGAFGATWLGWPEILSVDWDEPAVPRATDIARYRRLPDGTLELVHRSVWSRGFAHASGIDTLTVPPDRIGDLYPEGTEWDTGRTVYRAERARRRDAVPEDGTWGPVWTVMGALAEVHGVEGVRLVVWFEE